MTATNTPTADELREQVATAERAIAHAHVEIGEAALDGKSAAAPTKRMAAAREQVTRARAALEELNRRETNAAHQAQLAAASAHRKLNYEWAAEYMRRAEPVLELRGQLSAAEAQLLELSGRRGSGKIMTAKQGMRSDAVSVDLDTDLVQALPDFPRPKRGEPVAFHDGFTVERARELLALAEQRAAEEERGEGHDFSGQESAKMIAVGERRRALREENKRLQREADERAVRERAERQQARRQTPPQSVTGAVWPGDL